MKEAYYFGNNTAIINYTKKYCRNYEELVSSDGFKLLVQEYLKSCKINHEDLYNWLDGVSHHEPVDTIIYIARILMVFDANEVNHPAFNDKDKLLELIETMYNYWRELQRYSVIFTINEEGFQLQNFIQADTDFNQLCLNFYRTCQEKVQGFKNRVYRQLQAGTNASILLQDYMWAMPKEYEKLEHIHFINTVMLRTPLIIHPKSNKRIGMFTETDHNPIQEFNIGEGDWMCYPCKVGSLLVFCYFHQDFCASATSLANLFELASKEECINKKPDCIMLFGNKDNTEDTTYYHDKENDIWVGKVSYHERIEYFGYLKKMALTLHNLCMMDKGYLPIHGAMLGVYLKNGQHKNVMFMGDSGAGKSETIEAFTKLAFNEIDHTEIVFDDMGSIHIENGEVVAQGTEIGAFVRLDDLDKGSAYRDIDRSIFFNPESANARVVLPAAPYSVVTTNHHVDIFMYANNYDDKRGMSIFDNLEDAKKVFIEGKRFALGTTQEKGLSTTFFANPFGPMQEKEKCSKIIDTMFEALQKQNTIIGEIYTNLGLPNKGDGGIDEAAKALFDLVKR